MVLSILTGLGTLISEGAYLPQPHYRDLLAVELALFQASESLLYHSEEAIEVKAESRGTSDIGMKSLAPLKEHLRRILQNKMEEQTAARIPNSYFIQRPACSC